MRQEPDTFIGTFMNIIRTILSICTFLAFFYTVYVLFDTGYWWGVIILFVAHVQLFLYGVVKHSTDYTITTTLIIFIAQIILISTPFILYKVSAKGGNSNSARRNTYQRPASTLPLQRPRII